MRYFCSNWLHSLLLIILLPAGASAQTVDLHQLVQLAEYIGADYSAAVGDGQILDAGEYQEMSDFAGILVARTAALPANNDVATLQLQARALATAVAEKASLADVQRLSSTLRSSLLVAAPVKPLPASLTTQIAVQQLYQENCALCHGALGRGDGQQAKLLNPPPVDFTDKQRALNRSVAGLFDAIHGGIEGTSMPSFKQFTLEQQWSLAVYVGSLAFVDPGNDRDKNVAKTNPAAELLTLRDWVMFSPNELATAHPTLDVSAFENGRADLFTLFTSPKNPIAIARQKLTHARDAYSKQEYDAAHALAVSAYLDGFELIENTLDSHDAGLRKSIELDLLHLRRQINDTAEVSDIDATITTINQKFDQIDELLATSSLSSTTLFTTSAIILLREGMEALLVVLALVMVLIRANRRDIVKYVHAGWGAAVFLGVITWALAQYVIDISGASREVMEGVGALLAAVILFYVGFWMHNKSSAQAWQQFIEKTIHSNLQQGTLWGIAGLSFIAVYREIFETILFYQALASQITIEQFPLLWGGILAGAALLGIVTWIFTRYSVKLPLSTFFSVTTYLLLALSFVLMGKAIAALQEAAFIGITPLPVSVEIDWLGIHPTWQGVLSQLTIIMLSAVLFLKPAGSPSKKTG